MPNQPLLKATVNITAKDINGNNIAKVFSNVGAINFDYNKGMVNIVDLALGSYYAPLTPMTTITYTITAGLAGQHAVVMS